MQVSVPSRNGPRVTAHEHPIEEIAAEDHFGFLGVRIPRSKSVADHLLGAKRAKGRVEKSRPGPVLRFRFRY